MYSNGIADHFFPGAKHGLKITIILVEFKMCIEIILYPIKIRRGILLCIGKLESVESKQFFFDFGYFP